MPVPNDAAGAEPYPLVMILRIVFMLLVNVVFAFADAVNEPLTT
jgi:hypothetical protein